MSSDILNNSVTSLVFLFRTDRKTLGNNLSLTYSTYGCQVGPLVGSFSLFFLSGSVALTWLLCNCLVCAIGMHVYCENIIATVAPYKAYLHSCNYNKKPRRERHANVHLFWHHSVSTSRACFIGRAVQQLQHRWLFSEEGKLRT